MPPSRQETKADELPTAGTGFHTTHWTLVLDAREENAASKEAFGKLYLKYWYPIYAFIRRYGSTPQEAEDLTQEFFCRVLQRDWLANVHPAKGKFRSFLLICVKNFLSNERSKVLAKRRGGGYQIVPLLSKDAETRYALEPVDTASPDVVFERQWVFELLQQTINMLRLEYIQANKLDWFEQMQGFLPGGQEVGSRAEIAQKRGLNANAIDVAIHRMRQRFGALLRQRVAETVSSDSEVEEEIRHLMSVLGK